MRELRNRKVKFPMKMRDDARVCRIEELRNYTEPEDQKQILSYYGQGRLVTWLRDRYYDELADQVSELSPDDPKFAQKLFQILDMECKVSKKIDLSAIQAGNQKRARVQELTDDKEIIEPYCPPQSVQAFLL